MGLIRYMILQHLFRFGLFFCFLVVHSAKAETLTLFNWEDFLAPEIIEKWETETGHSLDIIYYDNEENRDAMIVSNLEKKIDLVVLDNTGSKYFGQRGTIVPLQSYTSTQSFQNLDDKWRTSCGEHSIPYLWGTLGLAYRKDKMEKPQSWHELLSPEPELRGHIGLLEDYTDLLAPALLVDGHSVSTNSQSALQDSFETIKSLLPSVLTFTYNVTYVGSSPEPDELHMALAYSGDQYILNEKVGKDVWDYTTLKEGTVVWLDCIAILASSEKKHLAMDFISFMNRPDIAAQNSDHLYVATANKAAREIQSKEVLNDKTVYPPEEIMGNAEFYDQLSEDTMLLRNRITSALVKVYESQ